LDGNCGHDSCSRAHDGSTHDVHNDAHIRDDNHDGHSHDDNHDVRGVRGVRGARGVSNDVP